MTTAQRKSARTTSRATPPIVPISVRESSGLQRCDEVLSVGVPFPPGRLLTESTAYVRRGDRVLHTQCRPLSVWPDGSVKWLLVTFQLSIDANSTEMLELSTEVETGTERWPSVWTHPDPTGVEIDTGLGRFRLMKSGNVVLLHVESSGGEQRHDNGVRLSLSVDDRKPVDLAIESMRLDEVGPLQVTAVTTGTFTFGNHAIPLDVSIRSVFRSRHAGCEMEICVGNRRAARHRHNLWDLGDEGSIYIQDLSLDVHLGPRNWRLTWAASKDDPLQASTCTSWSLYQDSSGGENWNSTNHVGADGRLTVSFPGYRVVDRTTGSEIVRGSRATPCVMLDDGRHSVAATFDQFWQNFPKAIRWSDRVLSIGLFPAECRSPTEMQGGERKRHKLWLEFGDPGSSRIRQYASPLEVTVDSGWIEASGAIDCFVTPDSSAAPSDEYVRSIVRGPSSFFRKREVIDEFGWRNFGDVYADHEAVGWNGTHALVSHYNNQYDFLFAAGIHFLRTGDDRWRQLMKDLARHSVDIDIYNTVLDRSAYSRGYFWHTDHYRDAATATHRTYSIANSHSPGYGGGPSNEHNYTSGLALFYLLTGDEFARNAVLGLAEWVLAMDDGSRSVLSLLDARDTGRASSTVSPDYHKPGRGAGNSINALLDAHALSGERRYLDKAQALLLRCIHPADNVESLDLADPEHRWSYLVFLQILGKFLRTKHERNEPDFYFYYARDSLIHYARWMLKNEVPYKDVLNKVQLPTETWSAQDIRKCHVMHLAALCTAGAERRAFRAEADFYYRRCLQDLLSFDTAYLTRPQVLISVYGHVHSYYSRADLCDQYGDLSSAHTYDFGLPTVFQPQSKLAALFMRKTDAPLHWDIWDLISDWFRKALGWQNPGFDRNSNGGQA